MLQGGTSAAVQQARVAGGLTAGYHPPCDDGEQMMWAQDNAGNGCWYPYYDCAAAQSDLTCNGGAGGGKVVARPSLKRGSGREDDDLERYSSAALLPIPGMQLQHETPVAAVAPPSTTTWGGAVTITTRMARSATAASTSGRQATTTPIAASAEDALVAEMCGQQGAEIDAVVRVWWDHLRAGMERARKRRCVALVRAAAAGAARALRDREVELNAARRRAAELEERLRQAAAESLAWCDVARGNEAHAAGLRATLETVLLGGALALAPATKVDEEGFGDSGDSGDPATAADDARSCCFVEAEAAAATSSAAVASRWACRACGGGEASVLLLPCRHLCLCKACEPRADACPVCLAAKSGAIHVAAG